MNPEQAKQYRQTIKDLLNQDPKPSKHERQVVLRSFMADPEYWETKRVWFQARKAILQENINSKVSEDINGTQSDNLRGTNLTEAVLGRSLTEEEQTRSWARQVGEDFSKLPQRNRAERKRAETLVKGVVAELLSHPDKIDAAGSVWVSISSPIYAAASREVKQQASEKWNSFNTEQLGQAVKVYAHSQLASELAGNIIKGYYEGPKTRHEKVDAHYRFVEALLDLLEDNQALEQGVRIINFESPILPRGSDFHMDFSFARTSIDDDSLLQKAHIADNVAIQLCVLTSLDDRQVMTNSRRFNLDMISDTQSRYFKRAMQNLNRQIRNLGRDEVERKGVILRLVDERRDSLVFDSQEMAQRALSEWPLNLLFDQNDPLRQKFTQRAAAKIEAEKFRRQITTILTNEGIQHSVFHSLRLPDLILEFLAAGIIDQATVNTFARRVLLNSNINQISNQMNARQTGLTSIAWNTDRLGETGFFYWFRPTTSMEEEWHPIATLQEFGFPVPVLPAGRDLREENRSLNSELINKQHRYLNRRGFRTPLGRMRAFRNLGYQYIDFAQDEDLTSIRTAIVIGNQRFPLKLDRYFNISLEGRRLGNPLLEQSLHYLLQSLLLPILCEEVAGDIRQRVTVEDPASREVLSRIGYLMWLEEGKNYTKQAVINCARDTGRDLEVLQTIRWQQRPDRINRFTTYVSPVIETTAGLEPIVVRVANVEGF